MYACVCVVCVCTDRRTCQGVTRDLVRGAPSGSREKHFKVSKREINDVCKSNTLYTKHPVYKHLLVVFHTLRYWNSISITSKQLVILRATPRRTFRKKNPLVSNSSPIRFVPFPSSVRVTKLRVHIPLRVFK